MLLGLKPVDQVFYFEEDTPLELIQAVQPDVLAKGGDYRIAEIVGADFVTARGGQVVPLVLVDGKSTTKPDRYNCLTLCANQKGSLMKYILLFALIFCPLAALEKKIQQHLMKTTKNRYID